MKLPEQRNIGVQSLGRHDVQAPLRMAEVKAQGAQQNQQIVNALADTAVDFEQAHTKHQVTQAAFDFDSDRRDLASKWLGKDTYNKGELEKLGVTLPEDDARVNIPAYEVLPDVMKLANQEALERRAGKIGNKNARSEFLARQGAALGDENLEYQVAARQQMTVFQNKQATIQVEELQNKGLFGLAKDRIDQSSLDENTKRVMHHKNSLQQETFKYEDDMTRLDVMGMKEDLAHLVVPAEEYKGYLPAKERGTYADSLRAAIAKAETGTAADRKMQEDLLKREAKNMAELSKKGTPPTPAQITATRNKLVDAGLVVDLNGFDEDVVEYNKNVGQLRFQHPYVRAGVLQAGDEARTEGKLSVKEQIALDQQKSMDLQQTAAFKNDPNKAWVALGGEEPVAPGTKGTDGKPVPMEQVLGSWSTLNHKIHAAQGVPGEDVRLIPKQYEQEFVQLFKDGNFKSRKDMIQKFSLAYGSDMEQHKLLWKQLGQVKNGAVYGAAGEIYARGDVATGDAMLRGLEAMETTGMVDTGKIKAAELLVDSRIGQTYWHDPDSMAQFRQAAIALSIGLAGADGRLDIPEDYTSNAVEAVLNPLKYRKSFIAVPAGVKPRAVENWLDDMAMEELGAYGGVSDPEWFIRGLHNGSLIPKTLEAGRYVVVTKTGVPVPNMFGQKLVLDYMNRPAPIVDTGDSVVAP